MAGQANGTQDLRGLKALVAFLGVLIVLGTALVIGVVIHRIYAGAATPSMTTAGEVPPVALAAGEHVAGIAAAGGDVAVWVNGPGGDRVLLVNPATGAVTVALTAGK
jgi:hypothetical protein